MPSHKCGFLTCSGNTPLIRCLGKHSSKSQFTFSLCAQLLFSSSVNPQCTIALVHFQYVYRFLTISGRPSLHQIMTSCRTPFPYRNNKNPASFPAPPRAPAANRGMKRGGRSGILYQSDRCRAGLSGLRVSCEVSAGRGAEVGGPGCLVAVCLRHTKMHSDAVNFQLNSHLSTLANIHKIYHTLNRLNLTEDVGQDDHQTGSLRSCSTSDCFTKTMPPRKKRRPAAGDDLLAKKSRHDGMYKKYDSSRIRAEEEAFSSKRCLEWFYEYAGTDDVVGPEGMEKFCEDIGVEPENVVMLVLAWKLDAQNMGYFTLQEWLKGMTSLQCDTTEKLRNTLDYLRSLLNEPTNFKLIYRYAFDFAREKDQRSLDMNTAKCMLGLLLGKTWPLFPVFHQFLEQSKYKVINKDQWCNVLEFSRTINLDLSNYDEDGAWPVLLDEFVEWYKEKQMA